MDGFDSGVTRAYLAPSKHAAPESCRAQGVIMLRVAARLACVVLALLTPSIAIAQVGGSGAIQGTVLDSSNAAIPGATVTATNIATGIDTVRQTTEAGVYSVTPLPPGTYRVTVTLAVF